jgi:hypothetical protein
VTEDDDLGPMPEPEIEPGEPNPGGADAQPENGNGTVPDLSPDDNPEIEDKLPEDLREEMAQLEDTSTKATRDDEGENDEPEKESPA